jgi:hypothetical protein
VENVTKLAAGKLFVAGVYSPMRNKIITETAHFAEHHLLKMRM